MINLRRSKQEYVETKSEELDQETLDYLGTLYWSCDYFL